MSYLYKTVLTKLPPYLNEIILVPNELRHDLLPGNKQYKKVNQNTVINHNKAKEQESVKYNLNEAKCCHSKESNKKYSI